MESMAQTMASAFRILKRVLLAVTGRGPQNRPLRQPDRRVNHRLKVRFEARISSDSGSVRVKGVNMHAEGALVMARRPLKPQSAVFVRLTSFRLMGFAQVRHCTKRGPWRYAIGLAFPTPLMQELAGPWQFHQVQQTVHTI